MIKIESLSKSFNSNIVLDNINLIFKEGLVYGIVGKNGIGKTTLFKCIAGLEKFKGRIITDDSTLKNSLGILLTENYFFKYITGREYIQLLCNARNVNVGNLNTRNIFELPLDMYASTYSSGMKKKLALTALLMQENKYIILDEPYNGIDIQSNIIITEIIHSLKKMNKCIIMSSHILSTLTDTCDIIYLIESNKSIKTFEKSNFNLLKEVYECDILGDKIKRLQLK